jgi:hypothetical protein
MPSSMPFSISREGAEHFRKTESLSYSSRSVFAGSILAIRRVGTAVAMRVTDASVKMTVTIVGMS